MVSATPPALLSVCAGHRFVAAVLAGPSLPEPPAVADVVALGDPDPDALPFWALLCCSPPRYPTVPPIIARNSIAKSTWRKATPPLRPPAPRSPTLEGDMARRMSSGAQ